MTKNHLRQGRLRFAPALATCHAESAEDGFSLVEVVIAIGLFAFVIVGILGLFPTALRIRTESALDTRSYMIAQQLFASVAAAPNISNVSFRDGPRLAAANTRVTNLLTGPVVMGYQSRSSMPYYYYTNPAASWSNAGGSDGGVATSAVNDINTMARLSASNVPGTANLYQITVEIRSPATLPLTNTRPVTFTTYQFFSN
ncbi:MAG: type IV pilus modification PilV family protein [Chthoniobacterales bacterium]